MKQLQVLRIVVASPSDVKEERKILEEVASELNRGIAKDHALYIEISGWELDAYPGFHVAGPQGLIDLVLRIEDCDLFIGIFWKRFGTPTLDAKSGTEHEFRKAYDAWKRNQHPQIMVYFNDEEASPRTKEELLQRGLIIDFQEQFPKEGLWWKYKGKQEFEKCVRQHLTQFIRSMSDLPQKSFNTHIGTAFKNPTPSSLSIEKQVALWLDVKASNKERTREQYERVIAHYRDFLLTYGLDLNSEDEKVISPLVEQWAKSGMTKKQLSDVTFNQHLSIVKSFYHFACELGCMSKNPIEKVKRRKEKRRQPHYTGNIFDPDTIVETITNGLKSIDRSTLMGKRDYALLSMFFTTLRRSSELITLKCSDVQLKGNSVIVTWRKSKDEKGQPLQQALSPDVSLALIEYLEKAYGTERPADAPLMISFSKQNRKKKVPIGLQALNNICIYYFNISSPEKIRQTLIALSKREGPKGVEKKLYVN